MPRARMASRRAITLFITSATVQRDLLILNGLPKPIIFHTRLFRPNMINNLVLCGLRKSTSTLTLSILGQENLVVGASTCKNRPIGLTIWHKHGIEKQITFNTDNKTHTRANEVSYLKSKSQVQRNNRTRHLPLKKIYPYKRMLIQSSTLENERNMSQIQKSNFNRTP